MNTNTTSASHDMMEFLADRTRAEYRITRDHNNCLFIRSPFDDETDFLYMLESWDEGKDPHRLNKGAEFAGVYSCPRNVVACASYRLREIISDDCIISLPLEVEAVQRMATDRVREVVSRGPVPETNEAETPYNDEDDFTKYKLDNEAMACFMDGTVPQYDDFVKIYDSDHAAAAVRIINHPEDAAQEYASRYLIEKAKYINRRMARIPRVILRLAELAATPGEHHLRRAIANSIHDEKTVRVDVEKDGKQLAIRIDACELKRTSETRYSTYRMDAPSRKAFENTFGSNAYLLPQDVARIAYGNKVLYEKAAVAKPGALELTPDQFAMVCQVV